MPLSLTFLGTGNAGQVPLYGCECAACERARINPAFKRRPCSALLKWQNRQLLVDAGLPNLTEVFPAGSLSHVLLTHFHMDHVAGLFHLRWGANIETAVYHPPDQQGCDDLYKHPGILRFQALDKALVDWQLAGLSITPIPLRHSKPTYGYLFSYQQTELAYLTDTRGLPPETTEFLQGRELDTLVLDCTHPPGPKNNSNHNNLNEALEIVESLQPRATWLTHISHEFDRFLLDHEVLPPGVQVARDHLEIGVEKMPGEKA